MARHPLLVFVGIAFGWSWSLWLASHAIGGTAGDALFGAAQLGPSLAGLAATWICAGRAELRALVSRALRWRVEPYWFGIALCGPILLWWVSFAYIAAVQPHSPVNPAGFAIFFPILAVQMAIGGGLGEELGWRGFLQSTLERRRGVVAASLLIGAIWALWSAPAVLTQTESGGGIGSVLLSAGLCIAYSLIFARILHGAGGSILVVALFHASTNAAEPAWQATVPSLGHSTAVALVHAAYVFLLALAALFLRIGSESGRGDSARDAGADLRNAGR